MAIRALKITLVACCALSLSPYAAGQQDVLKPTALQQELERLGTAAESLEHALPSFTCQETAISEWSSKGKIRERDNIAATLRAKRAPDGALAESYELISLDGKPLSRQNFVFPYYVSGGFDRAMRYFTPLRQACYRYSLSRGRIDFETAPDAAAHPQCSDEGLQGFALLDAEGNVTHLERRVSAKAAAELHLAPFVRLDFAPVNLNGLTFRLSHHIFSESVQGSFDMRFEATYSDCRLFTATVRIVP